MINANLIEIFSSIQGEGKYIGCRQIFVRLADCNLHCAYCDTDFSRKDYCNIETVANAMSFDKIENPVSVNTVIDIIKRMSTEVPTHSISFTGGEPLIHHKFIKLIAEQLNMKIFLETNGTLPNELSEVIDVVDIISMDIKLPSVTRQDLFEQHRQFINIAKNKDLYIKMVISNETTKQEFLKAVDLVSTDDILLVLQPVTPFGGVQAASSEKILSFQSLALKLLSDVRVIPQTHKIINLL